MSAVPKPEIVRAPGFLEWLQGFPCDVCVHCAKVGLLTEALRACGPSHAAHFQTKRNAGDKQNAVPMGWRHHRLQHDQGIETFQREFGYDFQARATYWWNRWIREAEPFLFEGEPCVESSS